jgi:hypothetical protein
MSEVSAFTRALLSINWDSAAPAPILRCPITGKVIAVGYDPTSGEMAADYEEPNWEEVPTLLFHYIPEVGEFSYITPGLQAKIDEKRADLEQKLGEDEAEDLSDFEILEEHLESLGEVPVVFGLTTHGFACGPVTGSVYVGLDLAAAFKGVSS